MTQDRTIAARELLAFYLDAGVDAVLGEEPVNRLADPATAPVAATGTVAATVPLSPSAAVESEAVASVATRPGLFERASALPAREGARGIAASAPAFTRAAAVAPLSPDAAVTAAREAARTAASLEDLRAILKRFDGCALKTTATQLVFADGNPEARIMFVGEAPGRDEDIEGKPFVGRSGKLLDRMMAAVGLDRSSAYIANIVPWRPPGNRTPTPQESAICLPFVLRQIELADPDVLVCLGGPSAATLLGIREGILKTRGRWFAFHTGQREVRAIATLHPAYLLRQPLQKRLAWRDFLAIRKVLAS
jgi:uracil-DNA glycosylase